MGIQHPHPPHQNGANLTFIRRHFGVGTTEPWIGRMSDECSVLYNTDESTEMPRFPSWIPLMAPYSPESIAIHCTPPITLAFSRYPSFLCAWGGGRGEQSISRFHSSALFS